MSRTPQRKTRKAPAKAAAKAAPEGNVDRLNWVTVARTTGEVPLITSADVGGQFNRVLQIHSKAFQDRRHADSPAVGPGP